MAGRLRSSGKLRNTVQTARMLVGSRGKSNRKLKKFTSHLCTMSEHLSMVDTEYDGAVATIKLNRRPVNSFSMQFMEEICLALEDVERNRNCQGLIITSNVPNVFCAGLDLSEVLESRKSRLVVFRKRFQDMWSRLYGSRLVTMAAINGHAIAGGCILSLACDCSVMASNFRIGLPELSLGLYLAPWMSATLINAVGRNKAEKIIYNAQVFSADEAAKIRLVDKVTHIDDVMSETRKEMDQWLAVPGEARELTKQRMRTDLLNLLKNTSEEDIEHFITMVRDDTTRELITARLQKLKEKKT